MMVSVWERTREIDRRIAVGARRSDIAISFSWEPSFCVSWEASLTSCFG